MNKDQLEEFQQRFALIEELETASKLTRLGFGELQNINSTNDFYFLPFQLLCQGFERLLKSYICIAYFEKHNVFPSSDYLKKLGHDLEKLLTEILQNYYDTKDHNLIIEEFKFLKNDKEFKELLYIISEFGKYGRYYNFDFITKNEKSNIDPKKLWKEFENKIFYSDPDNLKKLLNPDLNNEIYGEQAKYIIIIFEKFICAISRQFLWGTLGQTGKQLSTCFSDFVMLNPNKFGTRNYRHDTTRYRELPRKVHKRNLLDYLNRKFNKNYKHLTINKSEHTGEWPFYADKVTIECRYKHWCVVSIDNYDYALNAAAKGRYKLENTHDAGMAILGIGTGDFIKKSLEL